ncbi:16S rRNA (cytidine(1402)-2'-O)-methyltransferase [Prosthecomicrobium pneumaticum]|uniref:Ribosomal RNA small subunit methyltransferase I n=1 Tax=Prosthecomicrobium pneumaticum TaxID=81895 RepID=A0A7W9FNF1_9HYPH|nr:16S rRNA (cytidine(1402)-2'-O)-methyltransferase [Prosthecomicrobium pneumaticum]MBB5753872.1 16S rRNA (cytidine1402-2'-O)-methyltransferase [Prosthecomicrobium pneumaticum]
MRGYRIDAAAFEAPPLAPGLHIVATPIGHLGDVTLRALATLAAADLIAAEDTRVTRILTGRYGIETPLTAYHEHNAEAARPKILAALAEGKAVALVSDAGTPLLSDPGYRLVEAVLEAGHAVVPVPGASALLAALVAAGLPTDTFLFAGFLPQKTAARRKRLGALASVPATLVFYESPHRTADALADMAAVLGGERRAAVARELTKAFETVRRDTLAALAARFAGEPAPKGEIVILIGPPVEAAPEAEDVDALLVRLMGTLSLKEAAAEAAARTGLPRRDLYRRALALKDGGDDADDA